MLKIYVFVPKDDAEKVKRAMFDAGAGTLGHYDRCSWQVLGEGQFRPLKGSHPTVGNQNVVETVMEYKVEMLCEEQCVKQVIDAMKASHPYEEPAYEIVILANEELFC